MKGKPILARQGSYKKPGEKNSRWQETKVDVVALRFSIDTIPVVFLKIIRNSLPGKQPCRNHADDGNNAIGEMVSGETPIPVWRIPMIHGFVVMAY
jgi:hypothetical protein